MKTPRHETVVIPASQEIALPINGRYMFIYSCTISSIQFAFDEDSFTTGIAGQGYPTGPDDSFDRVRFKDIAGAGATVVVIVSDAPVRGDSNVSSVLNSILNELTGANNDLTEITRRAVGLTAVKVLDAVANARRINLLYEYATGTDYMYFGKANTVTITANNLGQILPGGSLTIQNYSGEVWAISGAATQYVGGYTE